MASAIPNLTYLHFDFVIMGQALISTYWMTFLSYAMALYFKVSHKRRAEKTAVLVGFISNASAVFILILLSGHAPVFRLFESFMLAALILALVTICCGFSIEGSDGLRAWVWLEVMLLLIVCGFADKVPSPFGYDYNYYYILIFHLLRVSVLSLTLFSSALYIQSRTNYRKDNSLALYHAHLGRNYLLLSTVLFLTSECVGIHWCLRGWGDFWQWSGGFFQSTLMVIFFMIAIHVPGSNYRPGSWRPILGMVCGPFILVMQFIRSLL